MKLTIYRCNGCGKREDTPFISRKSDTSPGRWTLFGFGTDSHDIHACSKECAVKIDDKFVVVAPQAQEGTKG